MGKLIDLTGQKFGYLTVLRRDFSKTEKVYWICQCDCGNIVSVRGNHLKSGNTKSCGCLQREKSSEHNLINLTGKRFNHLVVLERDFSKKGKHIYWICRCDCGNIVSVRGNDIKTERTKSCGCLHKKILSEQNLIDLTGKKINHLTILKRDTLKESKEAYWICKCDCGNIVSIRGSDIRNGHTQSCGCIKFSKGEDKIKNILSILKINFIQQKTFNNLKDKSNLKFDFFLPEYNCCIEYQGKQHYEMIEYFGGEKQFEEQKKKDNIKRQWCKNNNIKLIEIPYTDFNKLNEDYIKSRL